jgi:hypothetical protein
MASRAVVSLAVFGAAVVHGQSHTVSLLLDDLPVEEPATLVGSIVAVDDDKTTAVVECASDVPLSECPLAFEPQTITQAASLWEYELVGEPSPGAGTQYGNHGPFIPRVNLSQLTLEERCCT